MAFTYTANRALVTYQTDGGIELMRRHVTSQVCAASITMSLEAARDLSIPELLCMLNEKLYSECNRLQYHPRSAGSIPSLEIEVSASGFPILTTVAATSYTLTGILQIKSLETRVQDVLRFIPSLRNLLQPVNRLPSRVAQRCLQDDAAVDTRLIVPLTHVCR